MTPEEHLDNLVRHIELVRGACLLLGKRLIAGGRQTFGRLLVARGFVHDESKFFGIEWDYLHAGKDVPEDRQLLAIEHHRRTNAHHPEYWGGLENMPEIAVAEMICDWYARSQEFGTDLRVWIRTEAVPRYAIDTKGERWGWIERFVDLLLSKPFRGGASPTG
jgi:hypothetical protein